MTAIAAITKPSDLLRIADLTAAQLNALLDLADEMKNGPGWWTAGRDGRAVACLFDRPSTQTHVPFEVAAHRLGLLPIMLRAGDVQLGRDEPPADTARVLSSHTAAIVVRTFAQATVEELARAAGVPVINALTDDHHPCQALADLLTLRRHHGYLDGLRLAYVGEGGHVAHSLMEAGALAGMHVAVATPAGRGPDHDVTVRALALAAQHGGSIQLGHDARSAVTDADAVYTGAWASASEDMRAYRVDDALMRAAAPGAVFMHCLPARRGLEVTAMVMDGTQSIVWEQAANRLPVDQAVLHMLIGGDPAAVR
jgi:ornithine carbamoyltransferase